MKETGIGMRVSTGLAVAAALGLTVVIGARAAGQAPQSAPAAQTAQEGHGGPPVPGAAPPTQPTAQTPQQRPNQGRFPAHQRPPADPAVVERGRALYVSTCGACHGVDARGGQLGGPNLLRSALALRDQEGELIGEVIRNGRPGTIMVPMPLPDEDIKAIATFIHHLQSLGSNQGGPPPGPPVELNILVGDAAAGRKYFEAKCSTCHSPTGDLQGIASRYEPKALQNLWVSGGRAGRRPGGSGSSGQQGGAPDRSVVTARVTLPSGETIEGPLVRYDDFLVTIRLADGTTRTLRRNGDQPRLEINDPLAGHTELLAVLTEKDMHDVTAYLATLK